MYYQWSFLQYLRNSCFWGHNIQHTIKINTSSGIRLPRIEKEFRRFVLNSMGLGQERIKWYKHVK